MTDALLLARRMSGNSAKFVDDKNVGNFDSAKCEQIIGPLKNCRTKIRIWVRFCWNVRMIYTYAASIQAATTPCVDTTTMMKFYITIREGVWRETFK